MELADLVVINKADIDSAAATRAEAQITSALRLLGLHGNPQNQHHDTTSWHPQVVQLSALLGQGIDAFWNSASEFKKLQMANGRFASRRQNQSLSWMWERIEAGLKHNFRLQPQVQAVLTSVCEQVISGLLAPSTAARQLLAMAHVTSTNGSGDSL